MFIECLIQREGNTHLTIAGFDYVFVKNEQGRSVCQVHSSAHQDHLLSLKDFIPYEPPEEPKLSTQYGFGTKESIQYSGSKTRTNRLNEGSLL